jgi:hypothetical protein
MTFGTIGRYFISSPIPNNASPTFAKSPVRLSPAAT